MENLYAFLMLKISIILSKKIYGCNKRFCDFEQISLRFYNLIALKIYFISIITHDFDSLQYKQILNIEKFSLVLFLTLIIFGRRGAYCAMQSEIIDEKFLYSHHNNTALIKKVSMFKTQLEKMAIGRATQA